MKGALRNFSDDLRQLVQGNGQKDAIIVDAGIQELQITYRELSEYMDRYLILFEQLGARPGDNILSLLPNSAEAVICYLATIKGGYGYAPLSCFATEREVERWCSLIDPRLCIKLDSVHFTALSRFESSHIISLPCDGDFSWLPIFLPEQRVATGDSPKLYLSTSGTTGEPKAMVLDGNTLWSSGYAFAQIHNLPDKRPRFWNYLPMSYLGGLFNLAMIPLSSGGSIVITETFSGRTLLSFWQTVDRFKIDSLWLVPTIAKGLLKIANTINTPKHLEISRNIKTSFIGTAPISLADKQGFEQKFGMCILENYALSETTFLTSETAKNFKERTEASVGEVLPYVAFKFTSREDTQDVYNLMVKTPFLFRGYLTGDGEVKMDLDEDGFFATGDIGYLNEDKQVVLSGRRQDVIKKGGLFVSLKEIEALVESLPYIHEAAAVRVEHEFYGESYNLFVIPVDPNEEVKAKLSAWLHKNVVNYKWPANIYLSSEFPKTSSGKVMKNKFVVKGGD
ncbi:class I adenylate-forming enzyme family protein [Cohnella cellulosilytica]|uniref:Class I adenylate-forming enzyme family protein n=1 Tax=Cohnella cellulosilytica TaxID=986710 RepID=A0ABW2FN01_9BACL